MLFGQRLTLDCYLLYYPETIFEQSFSNNFVQHKQIYPYYIVKRDTSRLNDFTVKLREKRVLNVFADQYLNGEGDFIKEKYKDNFLDFYRNYEMDEEAIEAFKDLVDSKEIEWNEEDFEKDFEFINVAVKANMANIIWTRHEHRQMWTKIDRQLEKAVELFPEAKKLLSMK